MQQSQQEGCDIVFGRTDYGLVTMAITVCMPFGYFLKKLPHTIVCLIGYFGDGQHYAHGHAQRVSSIIHQQAWKIVSGKWKSLKNNGISLCVNPLC
jgi:hypothetical protein